MREVQRNSEFMELATRGEAIRNGCNDCIEAIEKEHGGIMSKYGRGITFSAFAAGFKAGSQWEAQRQRWHASQLEEIRAVARCQIGEKEREI